jgi:hypothetical protein
MANQCENEREEMLLVEYQVNVELWKHDDLFRLNRAQGYMTFNTILIVALGTLVTLDKTHEYVAAISVLFSLFGILVSRVWNQNHARNSEYIRFRRLQLQSIEAKLKGLTTFRNTYQAFYQKKKIHFAALGCDFDLSPKAKERSVISESKLPRFVGAFWCISGISGLVFLIIRLLQRFY